MKKTITIIVVCVAFLLLIVPSFMLWLIAAFADLSFHFIIPIISFVLLTLIGFITFSIENKFFYKKRIILTSAVLLILIGIIEGENYYKHTYIPSITVGQRQPAAYRYKPFEKSENLAHLDGESSLKFTNDDQLPVVDGATALFPIYCSFVEAVYPSDCDIEKVVQFNTTTGAYKALIDGEDDIIFVAQPSKEQKAMAEEAGLEFNMYPIGYEAFIFIVNKKNPVDSLTLQQIKDIYTGKITNWKELGGKDLAIRPFQRDTNSGSQTAFLKVMGKDAEILPPETHQVSGMEGLIDVVSDYQNHSNAIGYSFRYYVETMEKNVNLKILKLNGIEASRENIRNKKYPITDNFYAITIKGRESENTRKFIDWMISAQGQELIEKVGYVPLSDK